MSPIICPPCRDRLHVLCKISCPCQHAGSGPCHFGPAGAAMNVPDELKQIVDQAAGREHSADGAVMACLAAVVAKVRADERTKVAKDLRRAAKGRRHYAESWPAGPERDYLNSEAQALDSAARVAEGDRRTMCALLPVIMWTDAEDAIARGES